MQIRQLLVVATIMFGFANGFLFAQNADPCKTTKTEDFEKLYDSFIISHDSEFPETLDPTKFNKCVVVYGSHFSGTMGPTNRLSLQCDDATIISSFGSVRVKELERTKRITLDNRKEVANLNERLIGFLRAAGMTAKANMVYSEETNDYTSTFVWAKPTDRSLYEQLVKNFDAVKFKAIKFTKTVGNIGNSKLLCSYSGDNSNQWRVLSLSMSKQSGQNSISVGYQVDGAINWNSKKYSIPLSEFKTYPELLKKLADNNTAFSLEEVSLVLQKLIQKHSEGSWKISNCSIVDVNK